MLPIQSFSSFIRMTSYCLTRVPPKILSDLTPIQEDDDAVKAYGVQLCVDMCRVLIARGIRGFHFYTLNLERSVLQILHELGVEESTSVRR